MIVNANTKIAALIKEESAALEAIVGLSPKFTKLRNPVLRKVIGGRTSIAMASKMGGCSINDFFDILKPLGFQIDSAVIVAKENIQQRPVPAFMKNIQAAKIIELDVRPVFETGKDPLEIILKQVKALTAGQVLQIINSFEPTPLMHLLGKQGFQSQADHISADLVHTYFYKPEEKSLTFIAQSANADGWDEILNRFNDKLYTVDVRAMEMPLPMHTILDALEILPPDKALFVYHKRIPVFLLPELEERKLSYRIREISDAEVHLLIYKD